MSAEHRQSPRDKELTAPAGGQKLSAKKTFAIGAFSLGFAAVVVGCAVLVSETLATK